MNKPIKIYAENIDQKALDQFTSAMEQDYSLQGALMPDAHMGYSLPIGAVVATDGVIVPEWVGFDIGCGMCAVKTFLSKQEVQENAKIIFDNIYRDIPVGFKNNNEAPLWATNLNKSNLRKLGQDAFEKRGEFFALGTLGGGNHFIELGYDENEEVWIIIHSGSRGVGHGIAQRYMRATSPDGKLREGHYGLKIDSYLGKDYINDMNWALQFALDNRLEMLRRVSDILIRRLGAMSLDLNLDKIINRNHNHAEIKRDMHGFDNGGVVIHRKGATHAEKDMLGVIPGNMRDGSFIVRGKGNLGSLCSSSHGAGRVLGRKEAERKLNVEDFKDMMKNVYAKVGENTLDESPEAYKNIFEVMELQKDLVEVIHHIRPIINIKG